METNDDCKAMTDPVVAQSDHSSSTGLVISSVCSLSPPLEDNNEKKNRSYNHGKSLPTAKSIQLLQEPRVMLVRLDKDLVARYSNVKLQRETPVKPVKIVTEPSSTTTSQVVQCSTANLVPKAPLLSSSSSNTPINIVPTLPISQLTNPPPLLPMPGLTTHIIPIQAQALSILPSPPVIIAAPAYPGIMPAPVRAIPKALPAQLSSPFSLNFMCNKLNSLGGNALPPPTPVLISSNWLGSITQVSNSSNQVATRTVSLPTLKPSPQTPIVYPNSVVSISPPVNKQNISSTSVINSPASTSALVIPKQTISSTPTCVSSTKQTPAPMIVAHIPSGSQDTANLAKRIKSAVKIDKSASKTEKRSLPGSLTSKVLIKQSQTNEDDKTGSMNEKKLPIASKIDSTKKGAGKRQSKVSLSKDTTVKKLNCKSQRTLQWSTSEAKKVISQIFYRTVLKRIQIFDELKETVLLEDIKTLNIIPRVFLITQTPSTPSAFSSTFSNDNLGDQSTNNLNIKKENYSNETGMGSSEQRIEKFLDINSLSQQPLTFSGDSHHLKKALLKCTVRLVRVDISTHSEDQSKDNVQSCKRKSPLDVTQSHKGHNININNKRPKLETADELFSTKRGSNKGEKNVEGLANKKKLALKRRHSNENSDIVKTNLKNSKIEISSDLQSGTKIYKATPSSFLSSQTIFEEDNDSGVPGRNVTHDGESFSQQKETLSTDCLLSRLNSLLHKANECVDDQTEGNQPINISGSNKPNQLSSELALLKPPDMGIEEKKRISQENEFSTKEIDVSVEVDDDYLSEAENYVSPFLEKLRTTSPNLVKTTSKQSNENSPNTFNSGKESLSSLCGKLTSLRPKPASTQIKTDIQIDTLEQCNNKLWSEADRHSPPLCEELKSTRPRANVSMSNNAKSNFSPKQNFDLFSLCGNLNTLLPKASVNKVINNSPNVVQQRDQVSTQTNVPTCQNESVPSGDISGALTNDSVDLTGDNRVSPQQNKALDSWCAMLNTVVLKPGANEFNKKSPKVIQPRDQISTQTNEPTGHNDNLPSEGLGGSLTNDSIEFNGDDGLEKNESPHQNKALSSLCGMLQTIMPIQATNEREKNGPNLVKQSGQLSIQTNMVSGHNHNDSLPSGGFDGSLLKDSIDLTTDKRVNINGSSPNDSIDLTTHKRVNINGSSPNDSIDLTTDKRVDLTKDGGIKIDRASSKDSIDLTRVDGIKNNVSSNPNVAFSSLCGMLNTILSKPTANKMENNNPKVVHRRDQISTQIKGSFGHGESLSSGSVNGALPNDSGDNSVHSTASPNLRHLPSSQWGKSKMISPKSTTTERENTSPNGVKQMNVPTAPNENLPKSTTGEMEKGSPRLLEQRSQSFNEINVPTGYNESPGGLNSILLKNSVDSTSQVGAKNKVLPNPIEALNLNALCGKLQTISPKVTATKMGNNSPKVVQQRDLPSSQTNVPIGHNGSLSSGDVIAALPKNSRVLPGGDRGKSNVSPNTNRHTGSVPLEILQAKSPKDLIAANKSANCLNGMNSPKRPNPPPQKRVISTHEHEPAGDNGDSLGVPQNVSESHNSSSAVCSRQGAGNVEMEQPNMQIFINESVNDVKPMEQREEISASVTTKPSALFTFNDLQKVVEPAEQLGNKNKFSTLLTKLKSIHNTCNSIEVDPIQSDSSKTEQGDKDSTKQIGVSPNKQIGVSPTKQIGVSPSKQIGVSPTKQIGVSPCKQIGVSPSAVHNKLAEHQTKTCSPSIHLHKKARNVSKKTSPKVGCKGSKRQEILLAHVCEQTETRLRGVKMVKSSQSITVLSVEDEKRILEIHEGVFSNSNDEGSEVKQPPQKSCKNEPDTEDCHYSSESDSDWLDETDDSMKPHGDQMKLYNLPGLRKRHNEVTVYLIRHADKFSISEEERKIIHSCNVCKLFKTNGVFRMFSHLQKAHDLT